MAGDIADAQIRGRGRNGSGREQCIGRKPARGSQRHVAGTTEDETAAGRLRCSEIHTGGDGAGLDSRA